MTMSSGRAPRSVVLIGAAAGWLGAYVLAYVWVVRSQGGDVARWYVGLGVLAALACVAAAAGAAPSATTVTALVLTVLAMVAGLLSIGLVLAPAVMMLTVALVTPRARPRKDPAVTRRGWTSPRPRRSPAPSPMPPRR